MKSSKIDHHTYSSLTQAKNFRQRFLVLHYTAHNFKESLRLLTRSTVSTHYLIPTLPTIDPTYQKPTLTAYTLVNENERAWHAGESSWQGRTHLNDSSIGIEIVNYSNDQHFHPYPEEQLQLLIELCQDILSRYPDITPSRVVGHSDIAIGRKVDPGPLFPWKKLHQAGVGAWYDETKVKDYTEKFKQNLPPTKVVIQKLKEYGYDTRQDSTLLFKTFQMHFRPQLYSTGVMDAETAAIAYSLWERYV